MFQLEEQKPLKIAVLFFGRVHRHDVNYESIMDTIVNGNDVDFFLSHGKDINNPHLNEKEGVESFKKLFKPKKVIDEPIDEDIPNLPKNQHYPHSKICMPVNKKRVFDAMMEYANETNTIYDYVVIMRLDCYYESVLDYDRTVRESNLSEEQIERTVFIPIKNNWDGVNDQFAFGRFKPMQKYCSLIENIVELFIEKPWSNSETLLMTHLLCEKVHIHRFFFEYFIVR